MEPTEVILGVPLKLTMKLESEGPFVLHKQFGFCSEHTTILAKDESETTIDIEQEMCRNFQVQENPLDSEAKTVYEGVAVTGDEIYLPAGRFRIVAEYHSTGPYLDRYSEDDIRPVDGIWLGEIQSNEVVVVVKNPEGVDQNVMLNLNPTPQEATSAEKLSWFLKLRADEILRDYPKSTYAAWVLWKSGNVWSSFLGMNNSTIEEDFLYKDYLKRMESGELGSTESFRDELLMIVERWEPLYRNFPSFLPRLGSERSSSSLYTFGGIPKSDAYH